MKRCLVVEGGSGDSDWVAPSIVCVDETAKFVDFDCLIVISENLQNETFPSSDLIKKMKNIDKQIGQTLTVHVTDNPLAQLLIISPTGPTNRDYDDIRCWGDASRAGVLRAKLAGSTKPIIFFPSAPTNKNYQKIVEVSLLYALQELYQPIQTRLHLGRENTEPITEIGFYADWVDRSICTKIPSLINAMEAGRRLARDLGESDPEFMNNINYTEHIKNAFSHISNIKISVISNESQLEKDFPLLSAVARASKQVPHHRPRVIILEYQGQGEIDQTLLFAGKGIIYDSGGANLKVNNTMAGMSRDKCGASNVAGFMLSTALLKPPGLKIIAYLGVVRNSIGEFSYVSDEIIAGHSGVRVKIIDTDCEGRLVLADCLSHLRNIAIGLPNPCLISIATLTYHVMNAIGQNTAIVPNVPSKKKKNSQNFEKKWKLLGRLF